MLRFGLIVAALVLIVDQLSKGLIVHQVMQPPRVIEVTGFLNIVMVWNRGISFGLLNSASAWAPYLLIAVSVAVTVFLLFWLKRLRNRLAGLAVGMIVGGAIGNAIDRAAYGAVADFVDFHVGGWHWPAFNVADAGITVGVALLLLDSLFPRGESLK